MKKSSKILLAGATIWPNLYMLFFMSVFLLSFLSRDNGPGFLWVIIVPLHLLTMLLIMGLIAFYIVNVFRNDRVNNDMKVLWAVVIFMGGPMAMPVYWYLYIWRDGAATASGDPKLLSEATNWTREPDARRTSDYVPPPQPPDWR